MLIVGFTLTLLLMASSVEYAIYDDYSVYRTDYLIYLLFGYVTCLLVALKYKVGKWMLVIFFMMQSVTLFADSPIFYFRTGLSMYISTWVGQIDVPSAERTGLSINLLAIGMMILTWSSLKSDNTEDQ
ncbi:hypothetical protein A1OO_08485 [Enterovibrio norvegicus FF-33]|uniref:hypothetical protein n=1 Tax=Enterovibrio norvegicus TaxID=188144 RepID=UPI0003004FAF|nr:hypothetical protein [Enterovibrio norvegicus]OEE65836.1 hypothetical protein A1OO_08485 [Enterovibrio norvegicus FF-33]